MRRIILVAAAAVTFACGNEEKPGSKDQTSPSEPETEETSENPQNLGESSQALTTESQNVSSSQEFSASEETAISGSITARNNFKAFKKNVATGVSSKENDYILEVLKPGELKLKYVTTFDPLGIDGQVHHYHAKSVCEDLIYAGIEGGWRLPSKEELTFLRDAEYAHVGFDGESLKVRGEVWMADPEFGRRYENEYLIWMEGKVFNMQSRFSPDPYISKIESPIKLGYFNSFDEKSQKELSTKFDHSKDFICVHD